jgi:hypothetical protein
MSLLAHRPVGSASVVEVADPVSGVLPGVPVLAAVGLAEGDPTTVAGVELVAAASAPTGRGEVPFPPSVVPPSRWATPNTSAKATARSSSRRVQ